MSTSADQEGKSGRGQAKQKPRARVRAAMADEASCASIRDNDGFQLDPQPRIVKTYQITARELKTLDNPGEKITYWSNIKAASATLGVGCIWSMVQLWGHSSVTPALGEVAFVAVCFYVTYYAGQREKDHREEHKTQAAEIIAECTLRQELPPTTHDTTTSP